MANFRTAGVSAHQDDSGAASPEPTAALFEAAAAEFSVPADLLRTYAAARAQDEKRHDGASAHVFGPMGLREGKGAENEVARGAALLGVTSEAVKNDPVRTSAPGPRCCGLSAPA